MRGFSFSRTAIAMLLINGSSACVQPEFAGPCPVPAGASDAQRTAAMNSCFKTSDPTSVDPLNDLTPRTDILFVISNSENMVGKQVALARAIPGLLQKLDAARINYHIAVTTSDVGTLPPGKTAFPGSSNKACSTVSGDDGLLQNRPCTSRLAPSDTTSDFARACKYGPNPLCPDPTYVPRDPWIASAGSQLNVWSSDGKQADAARRAFQCISLVGNSGCQVEAPLEAMKRALDGHQVENRGFLRDDSHLVVVFVADQDDSSVQLTQRLALNPASQDCGGSSADPAASCFNLDFRTTAQGLQCDEPMTVPGIKHNCRLRTDGILEPLEKYVSFLSALRPASHLTVLGLWSPSLLDYQQRGGTGEGSLEVRSTPPGDLSTAALNLGRGGAAACHSPAPQQQYTTDPNGLDGQAQIRLSTLARRLMPGVAIEASICDVPGYEPALNQVAESVLRSVKCIPNQVRELIEIDYCQVTEADLTIGQSAEKKRLPSCGTACCDAWAESPAPHSAQQSIAQACAAEVAGCYCVVPSRANPQVCPFESLAGIWYPPSSGNPRVQIGCGQ